jgi:hypothetical protein
MPILRFPIGVSHDFAVSHRTAKTIATSEMIKPLSQRRIRVAAIEVAAAGNQQDTQPTYRQSEARCVSLRTPEFCQPLLLQVLFVPYSANRPMFDDLRMASCQRVTNPQNGTMSSRRVRPLQGLRSVRRARPSIMQPSGTRERANKSALDAATQRPSRVQTV